MSAEVLREAAALMRERAEAARAGRWIALGAMVSADWEHTPRAVTLCDGSPLREGNVANAAHIASWHPAVALAVADWLDTEAASAERADRNYPRYAPHFDQHAIRVATAYLGEAT